MTFKDLQKLVQSSQSDPDYTKQLERLANKPFWIWDHEKHYEQGVRTDDRCCFNHLVSLPQKDGKYHRLYDYEQTIFDLLEPHKPLENKYKHLFIKKATGLRITEFMLRYIAASYLNLFLMTTRLCCLTKKSWLCCIIIINPDTQIAKVVKMR